MAKFEWTRKKLIIAIVAALLVLAAAVTVTLVLVLGGKDGDDGSQGSGNEWSEAGVYYFDAKYDEYTLTLNPGGTFALVIKGEIGFGSYSLKDGALTLDFSEEGKADAIASLTDGVVTLDYNGTYFRLLKKVGYTVSFETSGGSSVPSVTVVNGKTVPKPDDPTRTDFIFVGWYKDAQFKEPFSFESEGIGADTVIYARWSNASEGTAEYTVKFDLNYDGAPEIDPTVTFGGKAFDLPVPQRDGYDFGGWWISMLGDPEKLSYIYEDGDALDFGATLYALWVPGQSTDSKLPAPIATVTAGSVSWNAISAARSYNVSITNASGNVVFTSDTSNTAINVPFDTYAAGEYTVKVTALANSGESNNSECVRYYVNKALTPVSVFNVIEPRVLNFNTVANAEKYLITVVCGNPDHNHTAFGNGLSRSFSFANCDMTAEGISFTVTAVAEGYASSTSEVFVYKKTLPAVEGLRIDETDCSVHWNEVQGASGYMVSVNCGDPSHHHGFVSNGSLLSVSLKECTPCEGGISVKVYPVTKGYISPSASEITYNKTSLGTPSDVAISGHTVSWSAVEGATEYEIKVGNSSYKTSEVSFDLSGVIDPVEGTVYSISVRAIGSANSLYSDEISTVYLEKPTQLSYYGNVLSWNPVLGADSYEVQVNDGQTVTVNGTATSVNISLTKSGVNLLKVRFTDGSDRSEWATLSVFAHEITFDTRGGSAIAPQYKAVGDKIQLPAPTKAGYTFSAWYNVPGGPLSNGKKYTDEVFTESGSIVLYAHYTANLISVTLNPGREAGGESFSEGISFEEYYKLAVPTPLSPTMAFGGWYSAAGGNGVAFTDAKGNSLAPWESLEEIELHAFWIDYALQFTLTKVNGIDAYMVSAGERIAMLEEVTVPSNFNGLPVAMVAGSAFKSCTALKVINLPDTLSQISLVDPFLGCTSLEAINVYSADRGESSRYWSDNGVLFDNGTDPVAKPKLLFMPLAKTGSYRIPEGVVEIPEGAFRGSSLSRITVPASVTRIGNEAFAGCTRLTSVTFGVASGAEPLTIGKRAFLGCASLEKITLPKRLSDISLTKYSLSESVVSFDTSDNAFVGCSALASVNVAAGNSVYKSVDGILYSADGKSLLYCPISILGSFTIPAGTQTVAPGAFIECYGITSVTVPSTVTAIGDYAFYGLRAGLTELSFLGNGFSDVTVGKYAFSGCSLLSEIVFNPGSRISVIDEGAFYGTAITELEIPASVTRIGKHAFFGCSKLGSVSFAEGGKPLVFEDGAFTGCSSLTTVHIPANVSEIPGVFSGCTSLVSVTIDQSNPYFLSEDGVVFNKDKTEILFFPQGKTGNYTLPSSVTKIQSGVFGYVSGINRLTLPLTLSYIGDEAFGYSSIKEIIFTGGTPAEELVIGDRAFEMTTGIKALVLPSHTKSLGKNAFTGSSIRDLTLNNGLETIGEYAFSSTYNLFELTVPGSVKAIGDHCFSGSIITSVTLEEGIETIGKKAFENTYYLASISIPASVTKIDDHAFSGAWLTTVGIANNSRLEYIGAYAFERTPISSITIPKTVKAVGAYAFYYCTSLNSVIFEEGGSEDLIIGTPYEYTHKDDYTDAMVTEILVGNVFKGATKLSSVLFPSRLTEIKANSFESAGTAAGSLTVSFGENSRLTTIGEYCFFNSALTSITIPASVKNLAPVVDDDFGLTYDRLGIGAYAFKGASKLESVSFELSGSEPLTIGKGAFSGVASLETITLPKRLTSYVSYTEEVINGLEDGKGVFENINSLKSVIIEDGGSSYDDVMGVVFTADLKELIFCPCGYVGEVQIPSSVTTVNEKAFYGCSGVTAISFAGGSEDLTIGKSAFMGCTGITEIVLPSNATSLGEKAFSGCTSLESITLSKRIDRFDGSMIENCPSLKNIIVEEGGSGFHYDNGALYSSDKTILILYTASSAQSSFTALPTTVKILDSAFAGNTSLTKVILPEGLIEIGSSAFKGCSALSAIVIPNTVELIGEGAFAGCIALTSPEFAEGGSAELVIGKLAFSDSGLSQIEIPKRTVFIGDKAFASSSLTEISFEDGSLLSEIGSSVFEDTAIREIALPEGLLRIGDSTFEGTNVEKVTLPASLKEMGVDTFRDCKKLSRVVFAPNSQLEIIPTGTFAGSSVETVTIPRSVTTLASKEYGNYSSGGVFEGCSSLKTVIFEADGRLTEIGQNAFQGCTSLREIAVPGSVSTIGYMAFYGCTALESVTIPATATSLGHSLFYGCKSLTNVTLNSKTTEIPINTFYNCSSLKSITIPSNVTSLGEDCFFGTSLEEILVAAGNTAYASRDGILYSGDLTEIIMYPPMSKAESITIPKEITSVASDIFTGMTSLKQVIFEEGGSSALVIGANAFRGCYGLHTVILPERLTDIGTSAFEGCSSLLRITVPKNVRSIGDYAFYGCYKLIEVLNKSTLNIVADSGNGWVGYYAQLIYTPESGESIVSIDENGYATAVINSVTYLIGYTGSEKDLVLPESIDAFYDYAFYRLDGIKSILIPSGSGAEEIGDNVFTSCGVPEIIFEDSAVPTSWGNLWNGDGCPVTLGYDGEEHTYSFVTGCDQTVDGITSAGRITLPTLLPIAGKIFCGWSASSELSAPLFTGSYYSSDKTTLYAVWINEGEEIPGGSEGEDGGTDFDSAIDLEISVNENVLIDTLGERVYYKFTPTVTGIYHVYISGSSNTVLKIWDNPESFNIVSFYADSSNPIIDKDITTVFTAGTAYYFGVSLSTSETAELSLLLTFKEEEEGGGEGGAGGDDAGGSGFDDAIELTLNVESSSLVALAGGKAYFKFTPALSGKFNVYVYGSGAVLTVYSSDRSTVADTMTNTGISGNKDVELTGGETYYLAVAVASDNFRTYIKIKEAVEEPGGSTPGGDEGSEFEGAASIIPGNQINLQFATSTQKKYFVYTASVSGDYRIYADCGWSYCGVEVYNNDKALVKGPITDNFGIIDTTVSLTAGETYYIVVYMRYSSTGSLSFTFYEPEITEPDKGDGTGTVGGTDYADAVEITPGAKYDISCDEYGKKMFFKYTAETTGAYHIYVSGNSNSYAQIWLNSEDTHQSPVYASWTTGLIDKDLSEFTEGVTYYIVIGISEYTGNLEFILTAPTE